ncbi:hypothetical protein JHK85_008369 [Glycine max]|nr:hypothetical protein JHK85_008369 [Glycine max]
MNTRYECESLKRKERNEVTRFFQNRFFSPLQIPRIHDFDRDPTSERSYLRFSSGKPIKDRFLRWSELRSTDSSATDPPQHYPNTRIAEHFIGACQSHGLLNTALVLFTTPTAFSHSQNQTPHNPLFIYTRMRFNSVLPNNFTFPPLFKSLSDTRHVTQAQCVHTHVLKLGHHQDLCVRNSILDVYASSGHVALHRQLFDEMPHRDHSDHGIQQRWKLRDALVVFEQMQYAGFVPNRVTMINALHACAHYGNVEMWAWIRGVIKREGWELDMVLGMALIDMYAKCGRVEEGLNEKNVFTWNAVIKGLALAKSGQEAIWWFNRTEKDGVKADEVTLLAVLTACSHSGLVDKGREIFGLLVDGRYGVCPNVIHYACMVDMLARSGLLKETVEFMGCISDQPRLCGDH